MKLFTDDEREPTAIQVFTTVPPGHSSGELIKAHVELVMKRWLKEI